jgi:hypothetical protein
MGSHSIEVSWDGKLTETEVRKKFSQLLEADRHEHGHGGYSGSWGTMSGLSFPGKTFPDEKSAHEYCLENTSKWDNAMAVKYTHTTKTITKQPTFKGKVTTGFQGAVAFYPDWVAGKQILVFADQLNQDIIDWLNTLAATQFTTRKAFEEARSKLEKIIALIKEPPASGDHSDLAPLPMLRDTYLRALEAKKQAEAALDTYHKSLVADLYGYSETSEQRWLIAGWAAS